MPSIAAGKLLPDLTATGYREMYTSSGVISNGVYGLVEKVLDERGRVFATKTIRFGYGMALSAEDAFHEIEANLRVRHPNIVKLVDYTVYRGRAVMVFEYMQDGSLRDYLKDVGSVAESDARMIMEQLIDAVIHIHESRVMHGDLTCSNVLRSVNRWAVCDLGMSKFVAGDGTYAGATSGTPMYLSPEAIRGRGNPAVKIDAAASDTWSLGVIMFKMLCGGYPYTGHDIREILSNIVANKRQYYPDIELLSDGAMDLMISMLRQDPADRIKLRDARRHPWMSGP